MMVGLESMACSRQADKMGEHLKHLKTMNRFWQSSGKELPTHGSVIWKLLTGRFATIINIYIYIFFYNLFSI